MFASLAFVCCKIATRVPSGIPGMSFSEMALRRADRNVNKTVRFPFKYAGLLDFPDPLRPINAYR